MRGLIGIFFSTNPARAWLVLTALVLANLVEGLGLATMMPLIAAATEQSTGSSPARMRRGGTVRGTTARR